MIETSARLLRLLSLLQARRDWSGTELAERLAVTTRTVRRDVDKLRELGYPVHATPGVAGGYRLGAGARLPPLLLDDDEAVAVAVGLRGAASGVTGVAETSIRALTKLEQLLPTRLRQRVEMLNAVTVPMPGGEGPTVDPATLTLIAAACRDRERLRFDYRDHEGATTSRTTEPYRLVHGGRRWYLVAYDTERGDWRTFRVDRMTPREPSGPRFAPREPPAADLAAYTSFGASTAAYRHQALVTVYAPAEVVAARVSPTAVMVEPIDERRCRVRAGSNSLDAIVAHLLLLGFDFEAHEPPELIDRMRMLAARLGRAITASPR
jgi:predicted DNA-binding transcriptional regulator YafY